MSIKPKNWIAVIPCVVLYDQNLTDKDKLVFAVISNLTHEKGFCWASNQYIAELLNCGQQTISRSVSNLNSLGYIINSIEKNKQGTLRKIYLPMSKINNPLVKNDNRVSKKRQPNTIVNNIIKDNSKELLLWINNTYKRKFNIIDANKLKARLKTFTIENIKEAIKNAYNDEYHAKNNYKYLTPEYFLRNDENLDKWINAKNERNNKKRPKQATSYTENISKEFGW